MGIWERVGRFKPVLRYYNRDINIVSKSRREDYFYVLVNHDNIKNDLVARVYQLGPYWYIWYEQMHFRTQVANFTAAITLLEREIMKCAE